MREAELERRWLSGDESALAEVHQHYGRRLERVAYRILGSHADAEDVVQKVFLAFPRAAYRGTASLWSYLRRAAVNTSVNQIRSRQRRREGQERIVQESAALAQTADEGPEARVLEGEILAGVARALLEVKPQHRRALILRIHHGLNNTEIAEQEGVPLATVGTWLRRGREELQRALGPVLGDLREQHRTGGDPR